MKHLNMKPILATAAALSFALIASARDSIAFVCAHPDDLAGAMGTAIRMSEHYDIHVIDFTRGGLGLGEAGLKDGTTAARRTKEEENVCAALGAKLYWLEETDGDAFANKDVCTRLANLLKTIQPRAVITHWPIECHLDHVMTCATSLKAIQLAKIQPEIYFLEQDHQSRGFTPMHYIDITAVQERKDELIRLYVCQNGGDYLVKNKRLNGDFRARNVGIGRFAEAFSEYAGSVRGASVFDRYR